MTRALAALLLVVFASALYAGILEERPLGERVVIPGGAWSFAAAVRADGQGLVIDASRFDYSRLYRVTADGTVLDDAPRLLPFAVTHAAGADDAWIVLSGTQGTQTLVTSVDDDLVPTTVARVIGQPAAVHANDSAIFVITRHNGNQPWLHVLDREGNSGTVIRLPDDGAVNFQMTAWGEDAVVAILHGPENGRLLRVLRVPPTGMPSADASFPARDGDWYPAVAAEGHRALIAISGDPLELLWLDPQLEVIERTAMPYAVPGSIRDDVRVLIATTAGFFLSHHQRLDPANERSRMGTFSPEGVLLEDVEFAPLSLLIENEDRILASWNPGTIRVGHRDPRRVMSDPIPIGSSESHPYSMRHAVAGDVAVVGWKERSASNDETIRLVRMARNGELLDSDPVSIPHAGWSWDLIPFGAGEVLLVRSEHTYDDTPPLTANVIDVQRMALSQDVQIPIPDSMASTFFAADWNGADLLVATVKLGKIHLQRLTRQFEPIAEPVDIEIVARDLDLNQLSVHSSGASRLIAWSFVASCRITCIETPPSLAGFSVLDGDGATEPLLLDVSFHPGAVAPTNSGWNVAWTVSPWSYPRFVGENSRLAHFTRDGQIEWDAPLQRPLHDPILRLAAHDGGKYLLTDSRLGRVDITVPAEEWTASPPSGRWTEARLVWSDRIIYLAQDFPAAPGRPVTARVTPLAVTDITIHVDALSRSHAWRKLLVTVTNQSNTEAHDVRVQVDGVCGSRTDGWCWYGQSEDFGSMEPGAVRQMEVWQRSGSDRFSPVPAYVTTSDTDHAPLNNGAVAPEEPLPSLPRRGVPTVHPSGSAILARAH